MNDDEKLDLSEWEVDEPPSDFAERVVMAARAEASVSASDERGSPVEPELTKASRVVTPSSEAEPPKKMATKLGGRGDTTSTRTRARWLATSVAFGMAAAGLLYLSQPTTSQGEIAADETRREVKLGDRAVAVLEPGASLKWNGALVEQARGNVFYRVERGDGFRVHTASGDVDVQGTCFRVDLGALERKPEMQARDWKMGVAGAAVASAMFVAVYEGKVAVSHAQERVTVTAGESATASGAGVTLTSADGSEPGAGVGSADESALENANRSLVGTVSDYKKRLETIEAQKKSLESKLAAAESKLETEKRGGDGAPGKSEFDLSHDELVTLAKEGTLKYMAPCSKADYRPDAETLQKLALAPQDGDTIAAAYKKVGQWRESTMRPLCQEAIGKSELAERITVDACMHLVSDLLSETDPKGRREAQQLAVDVRAGLKPAPGPNEKVAPLTRMMLATSQQMKIFEDELAKSFGPEEAHRIAYGEGLCMGRSTWGGGKK